MNYNGINIDNFMNSNRNPCLRWRERFKDGYYTSYALGAFFGVGNTSIISKTQVRLNNGTFDKNLVSDKLDYRHKDEPLILGYPKKFIWIHKSLIHHLKPKQKFNLTFKDQKDFDDTLKECLSSQGDTVSCRKLANRTNEDYKSVTNWARGQNLECEPIDSNSRKRDLLINLNDFVNNYDPSKQSEKANETPISDDTVKVGNPDEVAPVDTKVMIDWGFKSLHEAQQTNPNLRLILPEHSGVIAAILKPHIGKAPLFAVEDAITHISNVKGEDELGNHVSVPAVFLTHKAEIIVRDFMTSWLATAQKATK